MNIWEIIAIIAISLIVLFFLVTFICFYLAFYVPDRKPKKDGEFDIPPGKIYLPYKDNMIKWMQDMRSAPHEDIEIKSFDGLTLRGAYYEHTPGAPIELMIHGYRGHSERDMCGGMHRCFALKRNALIIDQRASGRSDGHVITFGIKERKDCLAWINYIVERFGPDVEIILTGISMGAATVMMASEMDLPDNVSWILADCGYTSPKAIIKKVIKQIKLPANIMYPLVKMGAKIYGGFDLEEASPIEAMKNCKRPVIFFHGDNDDFVPCDMSRENYEACTASKKLVVVPGAGHGLCFMLDRDGYYKELDDFAKEHGKMPLP